MEFNRIEGNMKKSLAKLKIVEKEEGFTLIEILVVILIIGILAAIAIPVFLNQRQTAADAKILSDTKNVALAMETYFSANPQAVSANVAEIRNMAKIDIQNANYYILGGANDWCITAADPDGKLYNDVYESPTRTGYILYSSKQGGINQNIGTIGSQSCNIYKFKL